MKTTKLISMAALGAVLAMTACSKDGAPGAQGPQGPRGYAGVNGTNGYDGNANVIGTNSLTTASSLWTASGTGWMYDLTATDITQAVVDKGIVQVFIQYGTEWWSLPDLNGINETLFGYSVGHVKLLNKNSDGSQATNPGGQTFRVVIITASNLAAHPNTDWTKYAVIKPLLNLPN